MKKLLVISLFFAATMGVFAQHYIQTTSNTVGATQDITHTKTLSIGHTNTLTWGQARLNLYSTWGNWMSLVDGYKKDVYSFANPNNGGRLELFIHDGVTNTNNWGVFTVRRDGNIGMGTTNPLTKLHVNGNTTIEGTLQMDKSAILGEKVTNGFLLQLGKVVAGTIRRNFEWYISNDGVLSNYVLDNKGKNRHIANYHTDGTEISYRAIDGSEFFKIYSGDDVNYLQMGRSNSRLRIGQWAGYLPDQAMVIKGHSTLEGDLATTGKVGIGTSTPQEKLQIGNAITFHDGGHEIMSFNYSPGGTNKDLDASRYASEIRFDPNLGNLRLGTSSTKTNAPQTRMYITKDGNVGIGSDASDPNYKLSVKGKVRAREVTVYTNWSDYVFYDNYQLPTLKEVEQHIVEKGHLINIPSAKEVEENGVKLGEINAKLLEKIEELTLYTIAQEKKLQTQEERLQKLEAFINKQ
ncbi:hypothetical protein ABW636_19875 [Aquimarina sp. 2201CG1-2-11]|uniref:hypothetical protein n=1 Tax=Aquimarina discodermiae TaxID=3231043 RepID=UPI0034626BD8